jgi:GntR family transcriptional repressor for pyruvate dehydrogenase complex
MSSPYQAVRRNRLSEEIVDQIEKLVLTRQLQTGDSLPSERELAQDLQVSRQALREALRILAQKGLVQVLPGRGTFVAQPSANFLSDSLYAYLRLNPHLVRDFLETRLVIEVETAAIAAQRAQTENIEAMRSAVAGLAAYVGQPDRYIDADLAFHTELARAAGNEVLLLLNISLRGALRESIRYFAGKQEIVEQSVALHRSICEAVAAGHVEGARLAMREHFRITLADVEKHGAAIPIFSTQRVAA